MAVRNNHLPVPVPVSVILDTDMGNDIDDALAMAVLHALQSRGECELIGVVSSKDHPCSAPYIDIVNTFYRRGSIPVGAVRNGVTPDDRTFIREVATELDGDRPRYPRAHRHYPEAVGLLRRLLAVRPDRSVTVAMIGFSTNMARLLDTPPDEHSDLDGMALFEAKVARVVAMAADFSVAVQQNPKMENREYNIHCDVDAAMRFFNRCPSPITFCGYEVGIALSYPGASIENDFGWTAHHPVAEAYRHYRPMPYDRPAWDPATVLAAVRTDADYFHHSPPGRVVVDERGIVLFHPEQHGPHRYLVLDPAQRDRLLNDIVELCARPIGVPHTAAVRV